MRDQVYVSPAFNFKSKRVLTILRGIPGSGKSTMARSMAAGVPGPVHLEADMYFTREGEYNFDFEQLNRAHRWCLETTQALLQTRGLVVVSNTFTKYSEMYSYVEYAHRHNIDCNVITLTSDYGSIHNVPEETMTKMRNRFQSHQTIMEMISADFPQRAEEIR